MKAKTLEVQNAGVNVKSLNKLFILESRSQMKWEDPLNLSILLSGGKETNKDSPSNGE